ncbi:MAG: peptide deformylase [Bacteroidota bacterium]
MSVLPIYLYGSDVLRQKARSVESLSNDTIKLIYDMMETMHKAGGIGLAANQVGSMKRVIVIDVTHAEEDEEDGAGNPSAFSEKPKGPTRVVLINPEIVEESGSWPMEEGCLSIPDVRADVTRSERIRVKFQNANFEEEVLVAEGLLGRVILHEIDHLNGVLFIDHLSSAKRGLLSPKLRKIKRGETEAVYPVVVASEAKKSGKVEV